MIVSLSLTQLIDLLLSRNLVYWPINVQQMLIIMREKRNSCILLQNPTQGLISKWKKKSKEKEGGGRNWQREQIQKPCKHTSCIRAGKGLGACQPHFVLFLGLFVFLMWTIFKDFIEFDTILLLFYALVFWPQDMWDLSSLMSDGTCTLCIGRQSLNN